MCPVNNKNCYVKSTGPQACDYRIEVQTGNVDGATTDASVFIQLTGQKGQTEAFPLNNPLLGTQPVADVATGAAHAMFQQGCLYVFLAKGLPDVGAFASIKIGHDGSGARNGM